MGLPLSFFYILLVFSYHTLRTSCQITTTVTAPAVVIGPDETSTVSFAATTSAAVPTVSSASSSPQVAVLGALDSNPDTTAFAAMLRQNPSVLDMLQENTTYHIFAPSNSAVHSFNQSSSSRMLKRQSNNPFTIRASTCFGTEVQNSGFRRSRALPAPGPQKLNTLLTDPSLVNLGPGVPLQVVLEAASSALPAPDASAQRMLYSRQSGEGSDAMDLISGLGKAVTISSPMSFSGGSMQVADDFPALPLDFPSTLQSAGLDAFSQALVQANMSDMLAVTPRITVFAPQDSAFQGNMSGNTSQSISVLNRHILKDTFGLTPDLLLHVGSNLTSEAGGIRITTDSTGQIFVNNAKIIKSNLIMKNGVVHVIDRIIGSSPISNSTSPSASPPLFGSGASGMSPLTAFMYAMLTVTVSIIYAFWGL